MSLWGCALRVGITKENHDMDTVVRIGGWSKDGQYLVTMDPVTMRETKREAIESGEVRPEPTMRLNSDAATVLFQGFMDTLWQMGYRPKDIGTAGHLAATQAHLDDMRRVAFGVLFNNGIHTAQVTPASGVTSSKTP